MFARTLTMLMRYQHVEEMKENKREIQKLVNG